MFQDFRVFIRRQLRILQLAPSGIPAAELLCSGLEDRVLSVQNRRIYRVGERNSGVGQLCLGL